jgi:hypothetical protein
VFFLEESGRRFDDKRGGGNVTMEAEIGVLYSEGVGGGHKPKNAGNH